MELYNAIIRGFKRNISVNCSIEEYLKSLQSPVKALRLAYRNTPVSVQYELSNIQSAYLVTYLPHYYQLIYKIFIEEVPDIFQNKEEVYLTFIGGGPGSEAYGAIKYIINNCPSVKDIHINILDINAATWIFSHDIVLNDLIKSISKDDVTIHWNASFFDLTSSTEVNKDKSIIQNTDLLVIQNCLNEISNINTEALKENLVALFNILPGNSYLLMSDMTSGARFTIKELEKLLIQKFDPKFIKTSLALSSPISLISVHHRPTQIITTNLLNGSDGLIPRKYIKYDYSLISKGAVEIPIENKSLGFNSIYRPLDFKRLDANNYINKKVFIGLDFGTSYTVVSMAQLIDGKIKVTSIPIKQKDHLGSITSNPLVASVISLVNGRKLLIGKHAAEHKPYLVYGKNCWHSFKQILSNLDEKKYPDSVLINHPNFKISNAREALTFFLKFIKDQIFEYLTDQNISQDVEYTISVPASFSGKEKQALRSCLISAGIECEDAPFIEEPNAALINYMFEENIDGNDYKEKNILVLDLGAGTVDVSILHILKDKDGLNSKLLSVVRLGNIGGNIIDEYIANSILFKHHVEPPYNAAILIELICLCEKLKIKICKNIITDRNIKFSLPDLCKSANYVQISSTPDLMTIGISDIQISYSDFHSIMIEYWSGTDKRPGIKTTLDTALHDASLTFNDIDKVIITGGGGRNPYIKHMVAELFSPEKIILPNNIQEQVARGAALQSFVLNSFGKNIITPILGKNIFLHGLNKTIKIFENGISIPSCDVEVYLDKVLSSKRRCIEIFYGEGDNCKFFIIPGNIAVDKLVFYIAPNQDLKCDIVGLTFENEVYGLFDNPDVELINLK